MDFSTHQVNKEVLFGRPKVLKAADKVHDVLLKPDNQVWVFLTQLYQSL